jgi:hypothetical protein
MEGTAPPDGVSERRKDASRPGQGATRGQVAFAAAASFLVDAERDQERGRREAGCPCRRLGGGAGGEPELPVVNRRPSW